MTLLLQLVRFIISNLATILGLTSTIASDVAKAAQEVTPYKIQIDVQNISNTIHDINWGNPALHTQLSAIQTSIAALQLAANPVVLPTTPPTGYGGAAGISASDVWNELIAGGTQSAGDLLADAGWLGINLSTAGARIGLPTSKYYDIYGTWWQTAGPPSIGSMPIFPIANILGTDTLSVFLERESYYTGWSPVGDGTYYVASGEGDFTFVTNLTAADFLVLRDGPGAGVDLTGKLLPVWPGALNVTFGTPVSISTGFTIVDTMDGVIVSITGVPTKANFFVFDDKTTYRNLGQLSFFTDDNEQESAQGLGFESAIYTPHTMFQAAGVKFRTVGGVTGTVTPWHRTPP